MRAPEMRKPAGIAAGGSKMRKAAQWRLGVLVKPDYSDLEAAESVGHIFGFLGPLLLIAVALIVGVLAIGKLFF
jgi:hypothetical protein